MHNVNLSTCIEYAYGVKFYQVMGPSWLVEFLTAQEAPVEPEMLARIDAARANLSPGIPHEEILREFGQ